MIALPRVQQTRRSSSTTQQQGEAQHPEDNGIQVYATGDVQIASRPDFFEWYARVALEAKLQTQEIKRVTRQKRHIFINCIDDASWQRTFRGGVDDAA